MARTCLTIVLAAGEGTRMKSALPKVLHTVAGLPMVAHVARAAHEAGSDRLAMVIGRQAETVRMTMEKLGIDATYHEQAERLGTAHAVKAAREAIEEGHDDVLVAFGDTPLVRPETLLAAREKLERGADVVVIGFHTDQPTGYGRLIVQNGLLRAIREEKEASESEKAITFCNGGLMAFRGKHVLALLDAIRNHNSKGEFYLTDAVEIANSEGLRVEAIEMPFEDVLGVNSRVELAEAELIWQQRRRRGLMAEGVSMQAPETVWLSHDTAIGADATIEPNVVFGPGVTVESGATIHAFCHLEEAHVAKGASVGPFARLRPGAELRTGSKVGNFCEVKKAVIHDGAKVNHLTYIGDAEIGANANIGAGTITCNYDGYNKFKTLIGERAFIGSNSALVAPVSIGDNAYVASGSVVTEDVPADAVGFARAKQVNKPGLAVKLREKFAAMKKARSG